MSNTLTKLKRLRTLAEELSVVTDNYTDSKGEFLIDEEDFELLYESVARSTDQDLEDTSLSAKVMQEFLDKISGMITELEDMKLEEK